MATTFGWKKKTFHDLSRKRAAAFIERENFSEETGEQSSSLSCKRSQTKVVVEDIESTCKRLTDEGIAFAERKRYSEAIRKWNDALTLNPDIEKLHEMKSQVLLHLDKTFEAIKSSEKAVTLNPRWPAGYQSLGRAQLKFGEFDLAVKNFSKAFHLRPDDFELFKEDLMWSVEIREQARTHDKLMMQEKA